MVERDPVLHRLLEAAAERVRKPIEVGDRLQLMPPSRGNLLDPDFEISADVIYLDPMFPRRKKKALVKKEMQILQALLGPADEEEATLLLDRALRCAGQRVVVKRPRISHPLGGRSPDRSFVGRSHRFDLYLVRPCRILRLS